MTGRIQKNDRCGIAYSAADQMYRDVYHYKGIKMKKTLYIFVGIAGLGISLTGCSDRTLLTDMLLFQTYKVTCRFPRIITGLP